MSAAGEAVRCLEKTGIEKFLHPACREFLEKLPSQSTLLLACSGGGDSVFMVLVLAALSRRQGLGLELAHVHHGLRGEAADADAAYVDRLGAELALPVWQRQLRPPADASEAALRDLRYGELARLYADRGAAALCLGQHADDLVENQLMALLGGASPAKLASPRPVRSFPDGTVRLRPLLRMTRGVIRGQLNAMGVAFCADASNEEPGPLRNYLRLEILPRLCRRAPQDIAAAAGYTQERMIEQLDLLDHLVRQSGIDLGNSTGLDLTPVAGLPRAIWRELLLRWWFRHHAGTEITRSAMEAVLCGLGAEQERNIQLSAALRLRIRDGWRIVCEPVAVPSASSWTRGANWAWASGPLFLPGGARLEGRLRRWEKEEVPPYRHADAKTEAWLAVAGNSLQVRPWRAGDRYRPLGAPGRRKLQDLFTDARLTPEQKRNLPVLMTCSGEILWIPGFPPSHYFRIEANNNWALQLTYYKAPSGFPHSVSWRRNPIQNAISP